MDDPRINVNMNAMMFVRYDETFGVNEYENKLSNVTIESYDEDVVSDLYIYILFTTTLITIT